MHKVKRAVAATIIALSVAFAGASSANAAAGEPIWNSTGCKYHSRNFLCGSYAYTYLGTFPATTANVGSAACYGYAGYYKRNSFVDPFDADKYGWIVVCHQV